MNPIKLSVRPYVQEENHTCGLCAASALYEYYGMNPDAYELRTYLGTDNILPYNFPARDRIEKWMGGTDNFFAGTLPPDMLAVLYWDGFEAETVAGAYIKHRERLYNHLANGNLAMAILYGCWHWVLITGMDNRGVWIADGIKWDIPGRRRHLYRIPHALFAEEERGLILVSRDEDNQKTSTRTMTYMDFAREYARGCGWAAVMAGRQLPAWMKLDRLLSSSATDTESSDKQPTRSLGKQRRTLP